MISSKDVNFVGYTYKNFRIVNDYQAPGMAEQKKKNTKPKRPTIKSLFEDETETSEGGSPSSQGSFWNLMPPQHEVPEKLNNKFQNIIETTSCSLPNITSSGIQFTAAQLPRLELMGFGMTICDPNLEISNEEGNDSDLQRTSNSKLQLIYQKLIIKHSRLKKLSLWGCSGLDALYLNCSQLVDLNINSCRNLHSERLLLQCPNFESVHASGCQDMMVKTIQNQVCYDFSAIENHFPYKRVPDGSKRVRVPYLFSLQPCDEEKKCSRARKRLCAVIST
ncbi:F-box/LRR-repeat protein 17 [Abeliophyllum distichum]|uniref:F-box/LRR-repeat protein 17 n=1 Tax=Abeliophyllum distichum TaxID=126358 RepID=A0ABD1RUI7_9LAMI